MADVQVVSFEIHNPELVAAFSQEVRRAKIATRRQLRRPLALNREQAVEVGLKTEEYGRLAIMASRIDTLDVRIEGHGMCLASDANKWERLLSMEINRRWPPMPLIMAQLVVSEEPFVQVRAELS